MSATSRKLLVAFDPSHPEGSTSDFLVPVVDEGTPRLFGTRSRKTATLGMMVYIGRDVTKNDVFARLVDSGRRIDSVSKTIESIETYLRLLQAFKIGDVLSLEVSAESPDGFRLVRSPGR
jgi:hypothetical protein